MRMREYLFGPQKASDGTLLLSSRFDIVLSVVLGFTFLAVIAFSSELHAGWTRSRIIVVCAVVLVTSLLAQRRRVVFGCAVAIVSGRFVIAALSGTFPLYCIAGAIICAAITWLLLRNGR
jgi:hypothetical protein